MGTHEAPLLRPSQHGAAAGCEAGPRALRNKLWVPRIRPREDTAIPPITARETEEMVAQRVCVPGPGPHRALDLQSAELPRPRPESLCLTACLAAWLPPLTAHFHTLRGTLFST